MPRSSDRGRRMGGLPHPKYSASMQHIILKRCPPFRLRSPAGSRIHLPPQGGKNVSMARLVARAKTPPTKATASE